MLCGFSTITTAASATQSRYGHVRIVMLWDGLWNGTSGLLAQAFHQVVRDRNSPARRPLGCPLLCLRGVEERQKQ